jgi:CDP-glucose 4,6-dehydratase
VGLRACSLADVGMSEAATGAGRLSHGADSEGRGGSMGYVPRGAALDPVPCGAAFDSEPRAAALDSVPAGGAIDPGFWHGRRVLLTGHTGFKGAWLALWLQTLGARVTGFSLGTPTQPSLYELARVGEGMQDIEGDVRDFRALGAAVSDAQPEVVLHMAAQSLVRQSFAEPRQTFEVNVMGTVNLLDALRRCEGTRVVVNVTSDKCYENREWEWAYREHEPMGGHDPYSSSKGCAELVTAAFRRSFFSSAQSLRLASARAGNVIGGGDWGADRLIPDIMRAALADRAIDVRNPCSVRPWQHVLNPLSGYLLLAQALWSSQELAGGWNFGPAEQDALTVGAIVERISGLWPTRLRWVEDPGPHPHEARQLKLDSSRARSQLGWRPRWGLQEGLEAIVDWYRALSVQEEMRAVTLEQIQRFQYAAVLT